MESYSQDQKTSQGDTSYRENSNKTEQKLTLPMAIIIAGVLIAGSVLYANRGESPQLAVAQRDAVQPAYGTEKSSIDSILPVTAKDHILGNPNAPVKIVEFSDLECPYCRVFHSTMHGVMNTYGKDGKVAWIYRNFPIASLHPKAIMEAHAAECVAELAGNTAFWKFIDQIFAVTPGNDRLDPAVLTKTAKEVGVSEEKFTECQSSKRHMGSIEASISDGVNAGVQGTPYSVVIAPNGKKYPVNGALNDTAIKSLIETALKQTDTTAE